ncbi:MAG: response regulator [Rikenellaceae bacterium]|nr:response regulator [Rikenellaceae bacterium]
MKSIIIHSSKGEFRALLRGVAANCSTTICEVSTREELFSLCEANRFDMLLTDDIRMFMNGSQAMQRIRPATMRPQVFVFAHDLSEDTIVALLEMGVNQFITLPLSPTRLRRKLTK